MFKDWPEHTALVKKSFGELGKSHPKMLQAYGALEQAAAAEALDAKTRELIAIAVAITTRCESCISVHAAARWKKPHRGPPPRRYQSRGNRQRNRRRIGHRYFSKRRCCLYLRFARFGSSRNPTLIGL